MPQSQPTGRTLRALILLTLMLLTTSAASAKKLLMVVGTYTDGTSRGIYTYRLDDRTGRATPLSHLEVDNPSFVRLATTPRLSTPRRTLLYAVTERGDDAAALHAIALDRTTGRMTMLGSQPTHGADPCHIETDGHMVTTANYSGGSLSVFPLRPDGTLMPMSQQLKGTTAPTLFPQNQGSAHIHCSRFTPDGRYLLATDFSANRLLRYAVGPDGRLTEAGVAATLEANTAPRHFVYSDRYVYVMSEVSGTVSVFRLGEGEMQRVQEVASDSVGGHGGADIHLSPDGRYLYASNRLKADGISIFAVDAHDGTLRKIGYQPTGVHPRNFNITPNGRLLLCACRDSGKIQVFRIDRRTGLLTDTHQDILLDKPVCVAW